MQLFIALNKLICIQSQIHVSKKAGKDFFGGFGEIQMLK